MAQHQEQTARCDVPPPLSVQLPEKSDLPKTLTDWSHVQLPVDILLLAVEDCERLACYAHLRNPFRSYHKELGYVYFGTMGGGGEDQALTVALMTCSEGSADPGGSLIAVRNAVEELRPKAVFSVGCCMGLNPEVTKLHVGDVVVSSKLTTEAFKTPVGKGIMHLVKEADVGWVPPLRNAEDHKVSVCCDGEILSGTDPVSANQQCTSHSTKASAFVMGGGGVFAAAHDLKIEWVIVRGISHFPNDCNAPDESWKSFASTMAASVVANMLNAPVVFKEWPHYEDSSAKTLKNHPETPAVTKEQIPDSVCLKECQKQLRSIYQTRNKVKIVPWDQSSAVHIDEIYTDLSLLMDHRKPSGVTQKKLRHYTEIFAHNKSHPAPKRILVYGQPGIGKTVFTQKTTFDWSQQKFPETLGKFDLVLLVRLRDVCNLQDVPSILGASEVLANDGIISVDNLYDYVRHHQEKVLLILDGYDEYIYKTSQNQSPVFEIWKIKELRDCCVVMTSREIGADKLRNSSDAEFMIDGFNHRRQKEFARRFLKDDKNVKQFIKYLKQHDLRKLAQIPLLLLMLCLLWMGKDRKALPQKRADIFNQFVETLFDHMHEKQPGESVFVKKDYTAELYQLGRFAFEALLQDCLYFPISKLPGHELIERLIEVGLFQVLNVESSLRPEKGVYFIHKSVQEYLAANFLKEELVSKTTERENLLSQLDSINKIRELFEVLKFTCELSEEAARKIMVQLGMAAKKEGLTEYSFDSETPSERDLSKEQVDFIQLCKQLFFYCSAETRKNLFPTFLSSLGGVLVIDNSQLHVVVKEKLVKTTEDPDYIFFTENHYCKRSDHEKAYPNLIILTEQLNTVIVSCSGEMKASEFLSNYTWRRGINEFFVKKEKTTYLYFCEIIKGLESFASSHKMIKELINYSESRMKTKINPAGESSEQACSTHALSRAWKIDASFVNRSDEELLSDVIPFVLAPQIIWIQSKYPDDAEYDDDMLEKMVGAINHTHKLKTFALLSLNVRSTAAGFIARILKHSPNLEELILPENPLLGEGVDAITQQLGSTPHLWKLSLRGVKMTKQQVHHLSVAVKHSSITDLTTNYHDKKGNPKPEHEWPSEMYPHLIPDLISSESEKEHQQILANTRPSIHDAPFPVLDPGSVGTFPVPPDPAAGPVLAGAFSLSPNSGAFGVSTVTHAPGDTHLSGPVSSSVTHPPASGFLYPHEALSGSSSSRILLSEANLVSGSDLSTVTQDGLKLACLSVDEPVAKRQRVTRPSTERVPSYPAVTHPPGILHCRPTYGTQGPLLHGSSPQTTISAASILRGVGISTVTHAPGIPEFCIPFGIQRPLLHGFPPQAPNLSGFGTSTLTHSSRIPERFSPRGTLRPPQHELQLQSAIPGDTHLSGPVSSSVTHPPASGFVYPHEALRGSSSSPILRREAHLVSGSDLSTVTQDEPKLAWMSVDEETRSQTGNQNEPEFLSSYVDEPVAKRQGINRPSTARLVSVPLYPAADPFLAMANIPAGHGSSQDTSHFVGYPFPYRHTHRHSVPSATFTPQSRLLYGTQGTQRHGLPPQNSIQAASNLSGLGISTVIHPSGIPGHISPYGTLTPPQQLRGAFPGDTHLSGAVLSSVTHPPGLPGSHPRGFQRGSSSGGEYVQNVDSPSDEPHPSQ